MMVILLFVVTIGAEGHLNIVQKNADVFVVLL